MNIKDQVLSIEQIQELQELGFDVEKYSSLKSNGKQIITKDDFYIGGAPLFSTMTIGDIINILPIVTEENVLNIFAFGETWSVGWEGIQYCGSNTLIDALFETLKWCIKEKHI